MKKTFYFIAFAVLLTVSCGRQGGKETEDAGIAAMHEYLPGDSMFYGLACDGCTDSMLVLLPYSGEDPDTFDIIDAFQQRRVFGLPSIGDEVAVIVNPDDRDEALVVINTEVLKGTWCYMVEPTLRHIDDLPERVRNRMMGELSDSVRQQLLVPREYLLKLKRGNTAAAMGDEWRRHASEDYSLVEYPALRHYTEWYLYNGRLILKADTISGLTEEGAKPVIDTADICLLMKDTMVLRFADREQHYFRQRQVPTE